MYEVNFDLVNAAIFRTNLQILKPVLEYDYVNLENLIGIDYQKNELIKNTSNFIEKGRANNALLWGDKGCGKSSLCKGVFAKFFEKNLRVVEISSDDLKFLPEILDFLREKKDFKFIIFCDDLSFEDNGYKFLKPLLEGSIEKPPSNVLFYATTNRRHIIKEYLKDNEEIHKMDECNQKLSLSERFGLNLSFYEGNFDNYLKIIDSYFCEIFAKNPGKKDEIYQKAKQFAVLKAAKNGRVAKQFYLGFCDE